MFKPVIHANFDFKFDYSFNNPVEIWIDNFEYPRVENAIKIFIRMEPEEIFPCNQFVKLNSKFYNHILTFEEDLLNELSNSVLFEFGTTWMDFKNYKYPNKNFTTSFVCGNKLQTVGHKLRQEIWSRQSEIRTPIDFYASGHNINVIENPKAKKILGVTKNALFDSMFHICVENSSKPYYFSEKVIDALITKTVPIYWGCYKINDYFDGRGIIQFENVDQLIDICNNLTEKDYYNRLESIERNWLQARAWWVDYPLNLYSKINELII